MLKVCSGAQIGADQAGLKAAKFCNIPTFGEIPKGCRTLDGPRPDLLEEYNLTENSNYSYPPRTELNVKNSDGTIRFASNFSSTGERCTLKFIKWHKKPYIDINILKPLNKLIVVDWIKDNNINILNVAGNSEQTCPGIGDFVYNYLIDLFNDLTIIN